MEQIEKLENIVSKIKNKESKIFFFTMDTKGNPSAGIANLYEMVNLLNKNGYNALVLHEKDDYTNVGDWLGETYATLPHVSIESSVEINAEDILVIPEIFSNIMHDLRKYSCKKMVLAQNYHYILELLAPGAKWTDYGFNEVITTSEEQANYIKSLFTGIKTNVVPVTIPSYFEESKKPQKPVIAILTREQGDALKIAKAFYLKYPLYKWISFKEFRNISREDFASTLSECFLAVWVDDISGFGTFPLEALECGVPTIAKVPTMIQDWMGEQVTDEESGDVNWVLNYNFLWTRDFLDIPKLISDFLNLWMTDDIPEQLYENIKGAKGQFPVEKQEEAIVSVIENVLSQREVEMTEQLEKIKKNNETKEEK